VTYHTRHQLQTACRVLAQGGLLAYPTEAVYGFGCDPNNRQAVNRLLTLKQRPQRHGLILIAAEFNALRAYVDELDPQRMAAIFASWPGPYTWLLPARPWVPYWLTGAHSTLAVRVTDHPIAAALCRRWNGALVSTSANRRHRPPARHAAQVRYHFGAQPDLYIVTGAVGCAAGPSQIRHGCTGDIIRH
jgi:L-threonylcarbamoyladenylate synthase